MKIRFGLRQKNNNNDNPLCDITMGGKHEAKICELVSLYILKAINQTIKIGIYWNGRIISSNKKQVELKLGAGLKLHEDKIARGDKIARRDKIARGQNCTKGQICTKTFLHKDKFLRGDKFARGDKIAQRQIYTKGHFCTSEKFARLSNLHGLGLKIRVKKIGQG